ncbi:putative glycosyl transferase [Cupriavidus sp. HMR-1]|uniref:glycosyltransferase n=1 Tax=Cupriavidus sp. HMR-1 TaxID=1249621 RepID=UPI0002A2AB1D|nr:glycosyltransferase [Cupriavidus sp. HMR-1]EKZ95729.1 putative glycosyl transferase [Cupriavidus sp. HMR-1]
MSNSEPINSQEYWDERFSSDWEENSGKEQSRFFAQVAVKAMPAWLVQKVRWDKLSVCDWGCAQGDGTETLAQLVFPDITGIDFSRNAIDIAAKNYPSVRFSQENLLDSPARPQFDVLFSSNTLEHFADPWKVFRKISAYASQFVVLLLPYREVNRHIEHEVTFDARNIPLCPSESWSLVHCAVVDTRASEPCYWNGDQVLLVYSRTSVLADSGLPVSDVSIDAEYRVSMHATSDLSLIDGWQRETADLALCLRESLRDRRATDAVREEALAALEVANERIVRQTEKIASLEATQEKDRLAAAELQTLLAAATEKLHAAILEIDELRQAKASQLATAAKAEAEAARAHALLVQLKGAQAHAAQLAEEKQALVTASHQAAERIHFLEYRERALQHEVRTLLATKSWRMTAPLRMVRSVPYWFERRMQDVRHAYRYGGVNRVAAHTLRYVVRQLGQGSAHSTTPAASVVLPAASVPATGTVQAVFVPAARELPDVYVFSIIDWHFRIQRPQHIAREFARAGHRVYYFTNHFEDSAAPGFSAEKLDETLPLYQIKLKVAGAPAIYFAAPTFSATEQIRQGMRQFRAWSRSERSYSLVQHSYWYPIAKQMQSLCLSYDCMDHHEGFGSVPPELLELESRMMERADLLVATSTFLQNHAAKRNSSIALIRNAGEYTHFCNQPAQLYVDAQGRKIIGYYGAIAEWFDTDLVARVAQAFPDVLVLLVGADTASVGERLKALPNVVMTGEVPYAELPHYLYAFDVCLLPFKVIPLTLATNPVKVYEYLSAGKSVVSIDLPEMSQFAGLVRVADTHDGFILQLEQALADGKESDAIIAQRKKFAIGQTWAHRVADFKRAIEALPRPKVSVIVLTYNNLALTKDCLDSLETYSDYPNLEIIIVDNASADESPTYLSKWAASRSHVKLILNDKNLGFAAGNNQGLAAATGEYLVILNNDTVVTRGWVDRMVNHFRNNPEIGILGPITNNIGNEAKVDTHYSSLQAMHQEAAQIISQYIGQWFSLNTVAFFCAMIPRSTYEKVGPMCEDYGVGFFEDDDYCRRVQAAGLTVACAEDVFVHHHLSASFNKLGAEVKQALFEKNRAIYEAKWGAWVPHVYKQRPASQL